jgi:hypothetical protein
MSSAFFIVEITPFLYQFSAERADGFTGSAGLDLAEDPGAVFIIDTSLYTQRRKVWQPKIHIISGFKYNSCFGAEISPGNHFRNLLRETPGKSKRTAY